VRPWIPVFLGFKAGAAVLALLHHPNAAIVVFFAPDPWVFLQFVLPTQQAFGLAATAFETDRREVWLTIDDGPDPASTPRVLELLREHDAKATFFLVGERVTRHPELARRIAAAGHTIGNHSRTHPSGTFWFAGPERTAAEIDGCVAALLLADVAFERYFRPPAGVRNPLLEPQLSSRAMVLVLWNARGLDGGPRSPEAALTRIARQIRPGAILLAHEAGPSAEKRVRYLELLLRHLSEHGYRCVLPGRDALRTRA